MDRTYCPTSVESFSKMTGHYRFQRLEQAKNNKKYSSLQLGLSGMVNSMHGEDVTVFLKF